MNSTTPGEPTPADTAAADLATTETAAVPGDAEQSEGLRQRKKRERGQALRQAALDLVLENGYTNVTVEDICERCGVSRRTFFNYFSSKEEALLGRADTVFDDEDQPEIVAFEAGGPNGRLLSDLQHLLASVVRTRLSRREEMHQYHQLLKQDPSLMQVQMSRMGDNERLFREMIQRRLDGGAGAADDATPVSPRAEALAALAMMAIKATFIRLRNVEGDPALVIAEMFDELRDIFEEESE